MSCSKSLSRGLGLISQRSHSFQLTTQSWPQDRETMKATVLPLEQLPNQQHRMPGHKPQICPDHFQSYPSWQQLIQHAHSTIQTQQLLGSANYLEVVWKKQVYFVNKTINPMCFFSNKITLIRHKLYQTNPRANARSNTHRFHGKKNQCCSGLGMNSSRTVCSKRRQEEQIKSSTVLGSLYLAPTII